MASTAPDPEYAETLLSMLENDRRRLHEEPSHAHIVLWMVEEVRDAASRLRIDRDQSKAMMLAASKARRAALDCRRQLRQSGQSSGKVRAA
jgi:hypothetical protein